MKFIILIPVLTTSAVAASDINFRKQVERVCQKTLEDEKRPFQPVKKFEFELNLPSEKPYTASTQAAQDGDVVFNAAACATFTQDKATRARALKRAEQGLEVWIKTFEPEGNPINDNRALPFLQAAMVAFEQFNLDLRQALQSWAKKFIVAGDNFYSGTAANTDRDIRLPDKDSRTKNNWQTWRLAIRSVAAAVAKEKKYSEQNKNLVAALLLNNLNDDGKSFDFLHRDALHYHVYNLEAWTFILYAQPDLIDAKGRQRILKALEFVKPYYLKQKNHIEFLNSKIDFDRKRRDARIEEYQNRPWNPERANRMLRIARCIFPEIQSWTTALNRQSQNFSPRIKLLAALRCERE